ncbi:MAG TPA: VOC family protein [Methylomirabilota bacterium]
MRFHHVGYAVAGINRYFKDFFLPLFAPVRVSPIYEDPIQRVRVLFAEVSSGTLIELVEPLDEASPVTRFIGDARGGLYHLCYEVEDLDAAVKRFRKHRCLPLAPPAPAVAFGGRRIVFLMTPQRDLIELVEAGGTWPAFEPV